MDFPLLKTASIPDKEPCRVKSDYFDNFEASKSNVSRCFGDKTVIIIGDSRGGQLFIEMATFLDDTLDCKQV